MKLQNLAIIFIVIILPIAVVLNSYVSANMKTIELQLSYDMKLKEATYEAIQAFQLNTVNSNTSTLADSKIRDIQASVNAFFTSVESKFSMNGYNKKALQNHIPALVYTLYDGYYIYTPYENVVDKSGETIEGAGKETIYDLKPYVYYSCRYKTGITDVVITYSLDTYITITGMCNGKPIELSGYLLSDVTEGSDGTIYYRGNKIDTEHLTETVIFEGEPVELPYRKINGTKYYVGQGDSNKSKKVYRLTANGILERTESVPGINYGRRGRGTINGKQLTYRPMNGKNYYFDDEENKVYEQDEATGTIQEVPDTPETLFIKNNTNALDYYTQALELQKSIISSELGGLTVGDAVDEAGTKIFTGADEKYKDYEMENADKIMIFGELDSGGKSIEDEDSNFNAHRKSIIKYCVEKNLSVAISNFDKVSITSTNFEMPKLKEEEWDRLTNNIGMISFLQGLSIGSKVYNGYAVINNSQNEEFVSEDSIYIETNDNNYHRVECMKLADEQDNITGAHFNINYNVKSMSYLITNEATGEQSTATKYYYPRKAFACYHCLVEQNQVNPESKKAILGNAHNSKLATEYYTALGRERYGLYRVENAF